MTGETGQTMVWLQGLRLGLQLGWRLSIEQSIEQSIELVVNRRSSVVPLACSFPQPP